MADENNVRTKGETHTLELWASAEVCESLKWTRRHLQLAREGGTFPEPVAVVAAGRIAVWDAKAVRGWAVENMVKERQQWFRHSEAVRMFRRGDSIHEIARQLGAKRDSVRKWLRDAGELPTAETQAL